MRARLEALPPAGQHRTCPLDKEKQDFLVEFWPLKRHKLVAEALGVTHTTALHWYRVLTDQESRNPQ